MSIADCLSDPRKLSAEQVYRPESSLVTLLRCKKFLPEFSTFLPSLLHDNEGGGIPSAKHSIVTLLLSSTVSFSPIVMFTDRRLSSSLSSDAGKIFGFTGSVRWSKKTAHTQRKKSRGNDK